MSVPVRLLLTPRAHFLLDLRRHDLLDDGQAQFGRKPLNVLAHSCDQLTHRELGFEDEPGFVLGFLFGLFHLSLVFSHRWFSWLFLFAIAHPV
jgi:hypothetical protein